MIRVSFTHQSGRQSTRQPKRMHGSNRHPVPHSSPCSSWGFLITCMIFVCSFTLLSNTSRAASPEKPNVLFIAIDDLNDWVGFLDGHLEAVTPHMDALAKQGCKFTNAHCDVPVCSPSRVSVMSGVTATKHGSYELGPKYEQLPALNNVPTMQRYFKDNGYYTLAGGKILHHGFSGRLSGDIDRSLGRKRSPRPAKPLNRPANWSRAWDWGKYPETDPRWQTMS